MFGTVKVYEPRTHSQFAGLCAVIDRAYNLPDTSKPARRLASAKSIGFAPDFMSAGNLERDAERFFEW